MRPLKSRKVTDPGDPAHYRVPQRPNSRSAPMLQIITARGRPALADSNHHQRRRGCRILCVPRLIGIRRTVSVRDSSRPEQQGNFVREIIRYLDARWHAAVRNCGVAAHCCGRRESSLGGPRPDIRDHRANVTLHSGA
jgi:hypothetical protein